MPVVILAIALAVVFGPQLWARHILKKHSVHRDEIPGTGGELALHLIERAKIDGVVVERTDSGDHYDPRAKAVRLTQGVFDGKSLTAVVVAAHEVGHAIQDHIGYRPLRLRSRLVTIAAFAERAGAMALIALPFLTALTRVPATGVIMLLIGLSILCVPVIVHLATLPVEFDASFRRALPVLATGYVPRAELPAARRILLACALTYVAASLATLLNFWRWISILRR
jgi:Zn-dependent membrane protease YugP